MIRIYGNAGSRAARCMWALEELGLDYKQIAVDKPDNSGRTDEYLAINPAGKVPMLVDEGITVTESYAINLYLARQYGAGRLWPDDRAGQAAALQWSFWVATETEPHIASLYVEHFQKAEHEKSPLALATANASLASRLAVLDSALAGRSCLSGDRFTIADLNVACGLRNAAKLKVELSPFVNVSAWLAGCLGRDAHIKVATMPQN